MTLPAVAKAIGIHKGHLSRIERGIVSPRLNVQQRLVELFQGQITRDEIAHPEEYQDGARKPVQAARPEVQP